MAKHDCIHDEDIKEVKSMKEDVSEIKTTLAVIAEKMNARDKQREKDRIIYNENIKAMKNDIIDNSTFRVQFKTIISTIVFISSVFGGFIMWLFIWVFGKIGGK